MAHVTDAMTAIAVRESERQPNQHDTLQMVSGEAHLSRKEIFLTMTLEPCPLKNLVFFTSITNVIIFELDILRAYDAFVDLGRQQQRLAEIELSL